jgi:hypothetical protein
LSEIQRQLENPGYAPRAREREDEFLLFLASSGTGRKEVPPYYYTIFFNKNQVCICMPRTILNLPRAEKSDKKLRRPPGSLMQLVATKL